MESSVVSRLPLLANHVPLGKPVSVDTNAGGPQRAGRRLRCLARCAVGFMWKSLTLQVSGGIFPHQLECLVKMQAITMDKSPAVVCRVGEVLENPSC